MIYVNPDIDKAESLPAIFYRSNSYFEELKEKVFLKSWQFVGHKSIIPFAGLGSERKNGSTLGRF